MGNFAGHCLPGVFFFCNGLWRLFCALRNWAVAPGDYKALVWHPIHAFKGHLRYLELVLILLATSLDIAFELLVSTDFHPQLEASMLNDYEHSGMLFMFFIFAATCLLQDSTDLLPLPRPVLHMLAGLCFSIEYLLFSFHSANHAGLEAQCHILLLIPIAACAILAWFLAWQQRSFVLDLAACGAVILQGTWFIQVAFSLFVDGYIPTGCHHLEDGLDGSDGPTVCESHKATHRAMSVMNLTFMLHVACVIVGMLFAFAVVMRYWRPSKGYINLEVDEELQLRPSPVWGKSDCDLRDSWPKEGGQQVPKGKQFMEH